MRYFMYAASFWLVLSSSFLSANGTKKYISPSKTDQFTNYTEAYLELYQMSPECFFPYKNLDGRGDENLEKLVRESMCSGDMNDFCDDNKRLVEAVTQRTLEGVEFKDAIESKECIVPKGMGKVFHKVRESLEKKKNKFLTKSVKYLSSGGLEGDNAKITKHLESYAKRYLFGKDIFSPDLASQLLQGPNKLLLADTTLRLARGNFYDLEDVDMIEAFRLERKKLKKAFLATQKEDAKSSRSRFGLNRIRKEKDIYKRANLFGKYDLESEETLEILREAFIPNEKVFELITKRRIQRAMWLLRNLGHEEKGDYLEEKLVKGLFNEQNIDRLDGLNLGISSSYRAHFKSGHSVVYKPHDRKVLACNAKKEVAAFVIDRMLNLNMVPLTFMAEYIEGKEGSSQYFVENAYGARNMKEYNGSKPWKFSKSSGRSTKPADMLLFDWFIGNKDRNADNYMILDTGKIVLIDHGMIFFGLAAPRFISSKFVSKRLPSIETFERLKAIDENPEPAREALSPYLRKCRMRVFFKKVHLFVKTVEKLQEKGEITLKHEDKSVEPI